MKKIKFSTQQTKAQQELVLIENLMAECLSSAASDYSQYLADSWDICVSDWKAAFDQESA